MQLLALILLLCCEAVAGGLTARGAPPPVTLAIQNVTLIDGSGSAAQPNRTVLVAKNRIAAIGSAREIRIPPKAAVVDGSGKFLIPGLTDMHVHTDDSNFDFASMLLVNGVTAARDMGCSWEHLEKIHRANRQIREGALVAPTLWASGPKVSGPQGPRRDHIPVSGRKQARDAVIRLRNAGVDFVKIDAGIARESYYAVADECRRQGLHFGGHVPSSITAAEASAAGQWSLEHAWSFTFGCSYAESELLQQMYEAEARGGGSGAFRKQQTSRSVETFDEKRAAKLFEIFARNRTWVVPTLVVNRMLASLDNSRFVNDPRFRYASAGVFRNWHPDTDLLTRIRLWRNCRVYRALFEETLRLIPMMHRAGVGILAGTDSAVPYAFPGFSLHDELQLMVEAGLTPMEALQAATRNPAIFLGESDARGTVEKGKIADLVLLDANPLEKIANTKKIHAVVVHGRLIAKADRQEILRMLESAAKNR